MKKVLLFLLCILLVVSTTISVHAANARLSHGIYSVQTFSITPSGLAELSVDYKGNTTSFTSVTIETYIQKRTLGFIWIKVDNGETNNTWVDVSTERIDYIIHDLQLSDTGTYRAVFKITFSGTGAADDVLEDTIECVYE